MGWGLFKKVVVADRLAVVVDTVYKDPDAFMGPGLILATIFFAFQIYCDFSGYSDIARGAARVLGFRLMLNFDRPYASRSVAEFWKRWHISLSTWFRDYLYIPLGGSRVSVPRWYANLLIVFLVSGLWHGANWTFVIWGALHGVYLVLSIVFERWRERWAEFFGLARLPRVRAALSITCVFLLSSFAWIFFRAADLKDAWYIVTHLFSGAGDFTSYLPWKNELIHLGFSKETFLTAILAIGLMEVVEWLRARHGLLERFLAQPTALRWACYYALIFVIVYFGFFEDRKFIYFQF